MNKFFVAIFGCSIFMACTDKPSNSAQNTQDSAVPANQSKTPSGPVEIGDSKYTEIGKNELKNLSSGNIDAFGDGLSDKALYAWSSGDNLVGKASIIGYWKEQRNKLIDTMMFVKPVWIPLRVNESQQGQDLPGNWLMCWSLIKVKYKNGKSTDVWANALFHFDSTDKIDMISQYYDKSPGNKALGIK
jgi:hypothetical protein